MSQLKIKILYTSTDYRIDTAGELYITNSKTDKNPAEYTVEIWRIVNDFFIEGFTFETQASHGHGKK